MSHGQALAIFHLLWVSGSSAAGSLSAGEAGGNPHCVAAMSYSQAQNCLVMVCCLLQCIFGATKPYWSGVLHRATCADAHLGWGCTQTPWPEVWVRLEAPPAFAGVAVLPAKRQPLPALPAKRQPHGFQCVATPSCISASHPSLQPVHGEGLRPSHLPPSAFLLGEKREQPLPEPKSGMELKSGPLCPATSF